MSIPSWASSMVRNYKNFFKETYGRDTTLTDEEVFTITNEVFDDSDNKLQNAARVEAMFEREDHTDEPEYKQLPSDKW